MPAKARLWAAECLERALNEQLDPMSRMLLLDAAEAWLRLADSLEISSTGTVCDFRVTNEVAQTMH